MSRPDSKHAIRRPGLLNRLFKLPVLFWRTFCAPILPPMCRFEPSCSSYALEALETLPLHRALPKIAWRILRCNPFTPGGWDPVHPCCDEPHEPTPDQEPDARHQPATHSIYQQTVESD